MGSLSAGQLFCLLIVTILVAGSVLTAWAKAFAARNTGRPAEAVPPMTGGEPESTPPQFRAGRAPVSQDGDDRRFTS